MIKRENVYSRVSRQLPSDTLTMTLFGKQEYTRFRCKSCDGIFLKSEAYLESRSKRKHNDQIRPFCVKCWDDTNGRTKVVEYSKGPMEISLESFLEPEFLTEDW